MSDPIRLSVVLPAYNEAHRLPPFLAAVRSYLARRYGPRHEVIVVDDGSDDGLIGLLKTQAADWPQLCWIQHPGNQGKGAAVRTGMLAARGELVLFADADGATPIDEEEALTEAIADGADVAIGSRLVVDADSHRSRRLLRGLAGRLFAAVARRMLRLPVRDTQCGFKMFRREAAQKIFTLVREPGYLFDLEVLALACRMNFKILEVPVNWKEIPGGHLRLSRLFPGILRQLLRLRRRLNEMPAS